MTANKTACIQHDTPTKNRFIGAMEATEKLCESAATYGIKPSTALNLWTKYKNTSTTKNIPHSGHPPSFQIEGNGWWCEIVSKFAANHFSRLHKIPG